MRSKTMQKPKKNATEKKGLLKRLLLLLWHDYKWMLLLVVACLLINAVTNVLPSVFLKNITDYIESGLQLGSWSAVQADVVRLLIFMAVAMLIGLTASYLHSRTMAIITQGFLDRMRKRMFNKMQSLPIKYFDSNGHGDIMSYYTNDIDTLRQLVSQSLPSLFQSGVILVCLVGVMLYYSVNLMVFMFLGVALMLFAVKDVGGKSARYFVKQQESLGKVEGYVEELMNGQKVVQVFCHEDASQRDFDERNDRLFHDAVSANRFGNIMGPIMGNIGNLLYVCIAIVGSRITAMSRSSTRRRTKTARLSNVRSGPANGHGVIRTATVP